jgi:hypothetical protein
VFLRLEFFWSRLQLLLLSDDQQLTGNIKAVRVVGSVHTAQRAIVKTVVSKLGNILAS